MPAAPDVILALVDASTDATGSAVIPYAHLFEFHTVHVYLGGAASVTVQTCCTGEDADYVAHSDALTATGKIDHQGCYPYMRVAWTGNDSTVRVDVSRYNVGGSM